MSRSPVRVALSVVHVAALAAALLGLLGAGVARAEVPEQPSRHVSAQAPQNPSGFVRLGHLAPGTGPVDIYLSAFGGGDPLVIRKAPYGTLTSYDTLTPGQYSVAMRPADAPADTAPMLSTQVDVSQGGAYTVLATGMPNALVTTVVQDDLTPPAADVARVRLVQGSPAAQKLTVQAVGGPVLARNVAYGTATGYADVPKGRWTLSVTDDTGRQAMASAPVVDLAAGTVNSLVVTDTPEGGFAVTPMLDATGINAPMAPAGGVETGAGGAASDVLDARSPLPLAAVVGLVLFVGLVRRRGVVAVRG